MRSYANLCGAVCAFENLLSAAKKAQRGKRFQENVGRFNVNLEHELLTLQGELLDKSYQPGSYREFLIYEPKKRMISAAPYRDRVVHHALCNVIAPLFEKTFIFDSYANQVGKGTHRAILRYQQQRFPLSPRRWKRMPESNRSGTFGARIPPSRVRSHPVCAWRDKQINRLGTVSSPSNTVPANILGYHLSEDVVWHIAEGG